MNMRDFGRFRIETMEVVQGAQLDSGGLTRWGLRWAHASRVPDLLNDLAPAEPRRARRGRFVATVEFRYDPMDLGKIWIWNRVSHEYVELECSDREYAEGMPLAFHLQLRREAAARRESFNTMQERAAARARRVAFIRSISPDALAASRREVARLLEIPRLRAITGNVVDVRLHHPHPGDLTDFIDCDAASLTALDMEILGKRSAIGENPPTDPDDGDVPPASPLSGSNRPLTRGGYR